MEEKAKNVRARAKSVNSKRSKTAVEQDKKKDSKKIFKNPTEKQFRIWSRSPNRYDIHGIDGESKTTSKRRSTKKQKSYDEEYAEYRALAEEYELEHTPYHDDMRARLHDDDHDEIARNSRWKWNDKDTKREYLKKVKDDQIYYANKKKKKKSKVFNNLIKNKRK